MIKFKRNFLIFFVFSCFYYETFETVTKQHLHAVEMESPVELLTDEVPAITPADEIVFLNGKGDKINLSSFRSKKLLLFFWASWNVESLEKLKDLDKLALRLKRAKLRELKDFQVIPVWANFDGKAETDIDKVYRANGIENLDKYSEDGELSQFFGITAPPRTIFWKDGEVITQYGQEVNFDVEAEDVAYLFKEKADEGESAVLQG